MIYQNMEIGIIYVLNKLNIVKIFVMPMVIVKVTSVIVIMIMEVNFVLYLVLQLLLAGHV